jgi:hypothetical protein
MRESDKHAGALRLKLSGCILPAGREVKTAIPTDTINSQDSGIIPEGGIMNRKRSKLSLKCFSVALLTIGLWGMSATLAFSQIKPSRSASVEITTISPNSVAIGATTKVTLTGKNFTKYWLEVGLYECQGANFTFQNVEVASPEHAVAQVVIPEDAQETDCHAIRPGEHLAPLRVVVSANSRLRLTDVRLVGEGQMDGQQFQDKLAKLDALDQQKRRSGRREADDAGLWVDSQTIKYVDKFGEKVFEQPISAVKSTAELTGTAKVAIYPGQEPSNVGQYWFRITFNDGKMYNFDHPNVYEMLKKKLGK